MKKLRELLSDTLIYGISSVLARFINYLLVPFYTDQFKTAQYGIVGVIYSMVVFLNVIFTFGMESAYLRYAKNRRKARDVFKTIQLGLFIAATVLALLLWWAAPLLLEAVNLPPGAKNMYLLMIGILWFDTMGIVPFAELRLVQKSILFSVLRTANVLLNISLNFYLILGLGWGIEAVFVSNLAASALTTIVLWIITARLMKGTLRTALFKKIIKFGLPFVPAGLGYAVNESLDRILLNKYMSAETVHHLYGMSYSTESIVGIYNACYKLAVFMLLLVQMFRMAWQPFFLRHADDEDAKSLYRDVFRYFNAVAGLCFLVIALFINHIVKIKVPVLDAYLIGKNYWLGLSIVPFLLGAYWFQGWYMNFSAGIFIEEETKVLSVITLGGAAVNIVVNLLLIPYYGMMAAATATLLSYAVMAVALYYQSRKVYTVDYQLGRAFGMMAVAVICLLILPTAAHWLGSGWAARFGLLGVGVVLILGLALPESAYSSLRRT